MSDIPGPQPTTVGEHLVAIQTKLDMLITQRDDHETRIRRLERALYIATGIAAAIGSASGAAFSQFVR